MATATEHSPLYYFDDVTVDRENFRVLKGGLEKTMEPRAFDVLVYLIEHRGRVVEKQEIFDRIWEDAIVTDNALTRAIKEIRRAIGDDASQPRYIETIPKRGYRFIANVKTSEKMKAAGRAGASKPEDVIAASHFRLIKKMGQGGGGVVYLVEDTRLHRNVVLKFLSEELAADELARKRFLREARLASALDHPNICTIHEINEVNGLHFIVMQYAEGKTLKQFIAGKPLSTETATRLATQIAEGLTSAHEHGVIHRDIKPGNIIITNNEQVKILDFGLAKSVACDGGDKRGDITELTRQGAQLGTPAYMSPEQARGEPVDHRSDIFSFGVVLYEMVTGRSPFKGKKKTPIDVMHSVLHDQPAAVSEINQRVPPQMEAIIKRALEKEPGRRYQSARELLNDLRRLKQNDQPMTAARTSSRAKHFISQVKQHRAGAALALLALAIIFVAAVYVVISINRRSPASQVQQAQPSNQPMQRKLWRLTFDGGLQSEPAWSPDGRFIAYGSDRSGNFDIWVQQVGEGKPVQVTSSPAHDWQPDWSPDGDRIVFRSERDGGGLYVVPALGGNERKIAPFGYRPRWSPDGSRILFYSSNLQNVTAPPKMYLADLDGNQPREVLAELISEFVGRLRVAWHPDGQRLSLWGEHRKAGVGFWTATIASGASVKSELNPAVEQQLKEAAVDFFDFLWSPSGRFLYFEGVSKGVRNLWKVEVDTQTLKWNAGPERLTTGAGLDTDIHLSPDGKKLAFTTRAERTRLWSIPFDAATGRTLGAGQPVTSAGMDALGNSLTRDGKKLLFSAQRGDKWELWEKSLEEGSEKLLAADDFSRVAPCWSRDGTRMAYARRQPSRPEQSEYEYTYEHAMALLPAGGGEEQILTSSHPLQGWPWDWSSDQTMILGSSARQLSDHWGLYLFPIAAAPQSEIHMRLVTERPGYDAFNARFSPDDRWISFIAISHTDVGDAAIYVVPTSGGEWARITDSRYYDDKPRWSPDGKAIYFISNRSGFFNLWGRRFDTTAGVPIGEPFRVTSFENPGQMVPPKVRVMEISLAADRLILPITEVSGGIWILENVDR